MVFDPPSPQIAKTTVWASPHNPRAKPSKTAKGADPLKPSNGGESRRGAPLWGSFCQFWSDLIVFLFNEIMYFNGFRSSQPSDCKNNSLGITPQPMRIF